MPDLQATAATLAEQAWSLRGKDADAAARFAADALAQGPQPAEAARAWAALCYARTRLGDLDGAEAARAEAQRLIGVAGDEQAAARTALAAGVLYRVRGQLSQAVTAFEQARDTFRIAGDPCGDAGASVNLALVFKNLGDAPRALGQLLEAQRTFHQHGDAWGEAVALVNVVSVYRDLGDDLAARGLAERVVALSAHLNSAAFEANARASLAAILGRIGERPAAIAEAERALALARPTGIPQIIGEALGIAAELALPHDLARARILLAEALDHVRQSGEAWNVVSGLLLLGETHLAGGDGGAARATFEEAAELAKSHRQSTQAAEAHRAAARVCETLGALPEALAHWRAADACNESAHTHRRNQYLVLLEVDSALLEARAQAEAARHSAAELAAANRFRTDLLAMVAHDLRSPLTASTLSASLLCESPHGQVRELAGQVVVANQRMARIVDALLDDAAAEHGYDPARLAPAELFGLLRAIAHEHQPNVRGKGQRLVLEGEGLVARVDAGRLAHALDNLIGNAVKYGPAGSTIVARLLRTDDRIRVEVDDEGPGVPPDVSLFHAYARGPATPTGGERTTGLGLYIARRMIELHGGTIGVGRAPAGGARFWFELPLR